MSRPYGIRQLANWILDYADVKNVQLTNMSLNKLVYFAYAHALVQHNRKLSSAKIEAWEHGPVFREIYSSFKAFGSQTITTRASKFDPCSGAYLVEEPAISDMDAAIVEEGIEGILSLPAYLLRELSHSSDGAWHAAWHHKGSANPGMQITDDLIISHSKGKSECR